MDPIIDQIMALSDQTLPGHLGIRLVSFAPDEMVMELDVTPHHMAPNGFLHAGAVVTLADTACGYATMLTRPDGATGFTTIELKSNFFSSVNTGTVRTVATPVHRGRNTQVWDAEVISVETGKQLALFRCSQMILWPKS
jgi:1,4-dihydroxy-2-naphthoyl-CoA hydrolase